MDVHGAGAQRSDPKTGEAMSRGPQGDMIRVKNYVRSVRGGTIESTSAATKEAVNTYSKNAHSASTNGNKAQRPSQRGRSSAAGNKFIARLDKDGDGKVSRAEFRGNDTQFNRFDINKDGYISEDEAPTGPPKQKRK